MLERLKQVVRSIGDSCFSAGGRRQHEGGLLRGAAAHTYLQTQSFVPSRSLHIVYRVQKRTHTHTLWKKLKRATKEQGWVNGFRRRPRWSQYLCARGHICMVDGAAASMAGRVVHHAVCPAHRVVQLSDTIAAGIAAHRQVLLQRGAADRGRRAAQSDGGNVVWKKVGKKCYCRKEKSLSSVPSCPHDGNKYNNNKT